MNYPWELDGWEKRLEATGWPPWEVEDDCDEAEHVAPEKHRLFGEKRKAGWLWSVQVGPDWVEYYTIHDHEAACLIRENNRVWLEKHRVGIIHDQYESHYKVWVGDTFIGYFDTYDTAQAAAIDAVLKEQADE